MTFETGSSLLSRRQSVEYANFERRLAGKTSELVLVAYIDHSQRFFRFGRLTGEKLVSRDLSGIDHGLMLPIPHYWAYPQGAYSKNGSPRYNGDIFGHHPALLHAPPHGLYDCVLDMAPLVELYVGNRDCDRYLKEHEGFTIVDLLIDF